MTRILVYSHDTFGLGNIRRMVRISEALVERDPDVSVLLVTGSPMLHAFRLPPRIDYVKLPCLARDVEGVYGVKHLDMAFDDAVRMRASLTLSAASDFNPDIVLVDKKPLGVAGELGPTLELLSRRATPPPVHLLLRDILDTPEATQNVWEAHDYHGMIERFYDSVLVVGDPDVFDVTTAYAFPASTTAKLLFTGYINRAHPEISQTSRRTDGALPTILIHAGGGEDGAFLLDTTLDALQLAGGDRGFACRIIGGPELTPKEQTRLRVRASAVPDLDWLDFSDAMGAEIARADLVISMGGYNSVCEVLSYRKRAIIVPRSTPVREQRIRAEAMAKLGLLAMIPIEELTPELLLEQIRVELERSNVIHSWTARLNFNGLDAICDRLLGAPVPVAAPVERCLLGFRK
jgi:predicted glycosyltransferase